jgi:hypothetical protein
VAVRALVVAAVLVAATAAHAQPAAPAPSAALRDGNAAATAGDWARVDALVAPLLQGQLAPADLAEAHRLAGLAAFFQRRAPEAEAHFLAYLRLDLDARLDPALVPPAAVTFFEDVRARHAAELRARRPRQKRYWLLNLVPPGGQIQNGDRAKAYVVGSLLGVFAVSNVTSFLMLRSWCTRVSGAGGTSATCDDPHDHAHSAAALRVVNIASGIGLILTYAYGVYDGVSGYRKHSREQSVQPFIAPTEGGSVFGGASPWPAHRAAPQRLDHCRPEAGA